MSENEIGFTIQHCQWLCEGYGRIGELYKRISFYDMNDIQRCHPIYYKQYLDVEKDLDKNGHQMNSAMFKHSCEKMVAAWENIVMKMEQEVENNCKKGMPRPVSKATFSGMAIYRDDLAMSQLIPVGWCTPQEIKDWMNKKITIKDLRKRNHDEYNHELGRRFSKSLMLYCDLSDDGSLNKKEGPIDFKKINEQQEKTFADKQYEYEQSQRIKEMEPIRATEKPLVYDNLKTIGQNFDKLKANPPEEKKDIFGSEVDMPEEEAEPLLNLEIMEGWQ
jgi:hypothetical protein